jgi:hypothetical protein
MNIRAVTLAFTACLVGSLAFADNPTDAPPILNGGDITVVKQESCKDRTCGQGHDKKDKCLSSKPKQDPELPPHNDRKGYPGNPEYPVSVNH